MQGDGVWGRVLRLALLHRTSVEAILDGRQPADVTLAVLMKPVPLEWREQRVGVCCGIRSNPVLPD